eukprot:GHVQ01007907.1.p1 GENE.GHVQ01007907.1~~GHVQ01007907.1.p1  ORF type:complete len:1185 (+),score=211.24 GHVQ01007907.1:202-3756(+)
MYTSPRLPQLCTRDGPCRSGLHGRRIYSRTRRMPWMLLLLVMAAASLYPLLRFLRFLMHNISHEDGTGVQPSVSWRLWSTDEVGGGADSLRVVKNKKNEGEGKEEGNGSMLLQSVQGYVEESAEEESVGGDGAVQDPTESNTQRRIENIHQQTDKDITGGDDTKEEKGVENVERGGEEVGRRKDNRVSVSKVHDREVSLVSIRGLDNLKNWYVHTYLPFSDFTDVFQYHESPRFHLLSTWIVIPAMSSSTFFSTALSSIPSTTSPQLSMSSGYPDPSSSSSPLSSNSPSSFPSLLSSSEILRLVHTAGIKNFYPAIQQDVDTTHVDSPTYLGHRLLSRIFSSRERGWHRGRQLSRARPLSVLQDNTRSRDVTEPSVEAIANGLVLLKSLVSYNYFQTDNLSAVPSPRTPHELDDNDAHTERLLSVTDGSVVELTSHRSSPGSLEKTKTEGTELVLQPTPVSGHLLAYDGVKVRMRPQSAISRHITMALFRVLPFSDTDSPFPLLPPLRVVSSPIFTSFPSMSTPSVQFYQPYRSITFSLESLFSPCHFVCIGSQKRLDIRYQNPAKPIDRKCRFTSDYPLSLLDFIHNNHQLSSDNNDHLQHTSSDQNIQHGPTFSGTSLPGGDDEVATVPSTQLIRLQSHTDSPLNLSEWLHQSLKDKLFPPPIRVLPWESAYISKVYFVFTYRENEPHGVIAEQFIRTITTTATMRLPSWREDPTNSFTPATTVPPSLLQSRVSRLLSPSRQLLSERFLGALRKPAKPTRPQSEKERNNSELTSKYAKFNNSSRGPMTRPLRLYGKRLHQTDTGIVKTPSWYRAIRQQSMYWVQVIMSNLYPDSYSTISTATTSLTYTQAQPITNIEKSAQYGDQQSSVESELLSGREVPTSYGGGRTLLADIKSSHFPAPVLCSDTDVQFFPGWLDTVAECIRYHDVCFQAESPMNTGFFVMRINYRVLRFWRTVRDSLTVNSKGRFNVYARKQLAIGGEAGKVGINWGLFSGTHVQHGGGWATEGLRVHHCTSYTDPTKKVAVLKKLRKTYYQKILSKTRDDKALGKDDIGSVFSPRRGVEDFPEEERRWIKSQGGLSVWKEQGDVCVYSFLEHPIANLDKACELTLRRPAETDVGEVIDSQGGTESRATGETRGGESVHSDEEHSNNRCDCPTFDDLGEHINHQEHGNAFVDQSSLTVR